MPGSRVRSAAEDEAGGGPRERGFGVRSVGRVENRQRMTRRKLSAGDPTTAQKVAAGPKRTKA